ncbi:beta-carotene 15,15'-dioxygenase [Halobellus salinus]|uniref:Probable beta-carotene 15,15'-dioxygenase n=1 Tax=Halobellus salinus TaxID=931585 RepID=A0A830EEI7_9EURY|nr:Brp/Blh family beta-carotene 15,15'-dioxygenase [Halobellus salinus]GGJ02381.1 beta-carotene 15,15'-dioxygenase [Halobellus salinus]SMP17357.1 beta-carotene 15,15'-monooxygenase, Brp/Blh family [Halobellus salinus]
MDRSTPPAEATADDAPGRRGGATDMSAGPVTGRPLMLAIGGRPAWLAVGGLTMVAAAATVAGVSVSVPVWARYAPLAASLLVFGLPHGAVDHLAPARATGERPTVRSVSAVGVAYLVLGGAYTAAWVVAPAASAVFFVGLTWFHWGQGDLYALEAFGGSHLGGRPHRVATILVRGGLPMLVPLLRFPERYRDVINAWVALFGGGVDAAWVTAPGPRLALGVGFAALTLGTLLAGWRRGGGREWRRDAAETGLLWAFFLLVPPVFAVGVYFCVWHSLRHIARLAGVDPASGAAFADRGAIAALVRTGRDALPLTVVSIAMIAGVVAVVGVGTDPGTLTALYLVCIAVLTLPHVAIVTRMDRAEGAGLSRRAPEQ